MIIHTNIQGIPCEVELEYHKAYRGAREGCMQLEPDEPEGFDIVGVYKVDDKKQRHMQWLDNKMTDEDRDRIYQKAWGEL
jgi:hypothetical protein